MDYSLDHGQEWANLEFFEAWRYTTDSFFHIELEIPEEAKSNQIRFRFTQNVFESARDNWALDNVKVSASRKNIHASDGVCFNFSSFLSVVFSSLLYRFFIDLKQNGKPMTSMCPI